MSESGSTRPPRRWRITTLLLFYLVLVASFTITAIKLTHGSSVANEAYNKVIHNTLNTAQVISRLQKETSEIQASMTRMLFNSAPDDIEDEQEKIRQSKSRSAADWLALDTISHDASLDLVYYELVALNKQNNRLMDSVIGANRDNPEQNDAAIRLYYERQLPAYQDFESSLRMLSSKLTDDIGKQQQQANENISSGVKEIDIWLAICFIIIVTGMVVITNHHYKLLLAQRQLSEERQINYEHASRLTIRAQEEERNHIGKELHDNINQILSVVKLNLELMKEGSQATTSLPSIIIYLDRAIQEIRYLSKSLSNPVTKDLTVKDSIADVVEAMRKASPDVKYHLYLEDASAELYMNPEIRINLYRIFQEAVNNIMRHAEATEVEIRLSYDNETATLIVQDNGKGFDIKKSRQGIGINNIYSRAQAFQGTVSFESQPGHGCLLTVQLPYQVVADPIIDG